MSVCAEPEVRSAVTAKDCALARELFVEYATGLGFDLCFQNFERELAELPGEYVAACRGALLLAYCNGNAVGCVALHASFGAAIDGPICEIKRLYVNPHWRGQNIGRALLLAAIEEGRRFGYTHMRLDTVPSKMAKAIDIYRRTGFYEIPAYRPNPAPDVMYMEIEL